MAIPRFLQMHVTLQPPDQRVDDLCLVQNSYFEIKGLKILKEAFFGILSGQENVTYKCIIHIGKETKRQMFLGALNKEK